jgi:hypothetical protein
VEGLNCNLVTAVQGSECVPFLEMIEAVFNGGGVG